MTDGVMVAQRFLAPFVGVRVPIGQPKKRLERGVFLYSDMGREPNGFDHKSCVASFSGKLCEAKPRRASRAPLCEGPYFIFYCKTNFL